MDYQYLSVSTSQVEDNEYSDEEHVRENVDQHEVPSHQQRCEEKHALDKFFSERDHR